MAACWIPLTLTTNILTKENVVKKLSDLEDATITEETTAEVWENTRICDFAICVS